MPARERSGDKRGVGIFSDDLMVFKNGRILLVMIKM